MPGGIIPIKAAEGLAEKYCCPVVVVFAIHPDKENFTVTTYGQTKKLCKVAAAYGEKLAAAVYDAAKLIQVEPKHLPEEPAIFAPAQGSPAVSARVDSTPGLTGDKP